MPTLVDIEGFETQVKVANATATMNPALWTTAADTASLITFVDGCNGLGKAVQIAADGTNNVRLIRNFTTAGTLFVVSVYVRVATVGASANTRWFYVNSDIIGFLGVNSDGTCNAGWAGGTRQDGPAINDGFWHRMDFRFNTSPATHTIDWQLDGVAQTQATGAGVAASNQTFWAVGANPPVAGADADIQVDHIVISATTGDYPMGPHTVFAVVPNADGTHVAGTNVMERASDGTDIGVVTAWDLLDEWPPTTGLDNADTVTSSASGASNYAEVQFQDAPAYATSTLWGVSGIVAHQSDTTGANTGISRIVDSAGTTLTDIYSGDMSEITDHYTRRLITAPGGGWTVSNFNGVKGRVGFGTLQPGAPEWLALQLQAATPDVPTSLPGRRRERIWRPPGPGWYT